MALLMLSTILVLPASAGMIGIDGPYKDKITHEYTIMGYISDTGEERIEVDFRNGEDSESYLSTSENIPALRQRIFQYCEMNGMKAFLFAWNDVEMDAELERQISAGDKIEISSADSDDNGASFGNSATALWWTDTAVYGSTATSVTVNPYFPVTMVMEDQCEPEVAKIREYASSNIIDLIRTDSRMRDELSFHEWVATEVMIPDSALHLYCDAQTLADKLNGRDTDHALSLYYRAKQANIDLTQTNVIGTSVGLNQPDFGYNLNEQQTAWLSELMSEI